MTRAPSRRASTGHQRTAGPNATKIGSTPKNAALSGAAEGTGKGQDAVAPSPNAAADALQTDGSTASPSDRDAAHARGDLGGAVLRAVVVNGSLLAMWFTLAAATGIRGRIVAFVAMALATRLAGSLLCLGRLSGPLGITLKASVWLWTAAAITAILPEARWLWGIGIAAAGARLEHDRHALHLMRRFMSMLAPTVLMCGLATAAYLFPMPPPWPVVLAAAILAVGAALLVRRIRHRSQRRSFWAQATAPLLVLVASAAALGVGGERAGLGAMGMLWAQLAVLSASATMALLLVSSFARRYVAGTVSPHVRHRQQVTPRMEAEHATWRSAVQDFVDRGQQGPMAEALQTTDDPSLRDTLKPVISYQVPRTPPLVSPAWLLAGMLLRAMLVATAMGLFAYHAFDDTVELFVTGQVVVSPTVAFTLMGLSISIIVARTWRYGLPRVASAALMSSGVALFALAEHIQREELLYRWTGQGPIWYWLTVTALALLPWLGLLLRQRPTPLYAVPPDALDDAASACQAQARNNIVQRLMLMGAIWLGMTIFATFAPSAVPPVGGILLAATGAAVAHPVTVTVALLVRQTNVRRIAAKQRNERLRLFRSTWPDLAQRE